MAASPILWPYYLDHRYYRAGHEAVIETKLWKFVSRNKAAINVPATRVVRRRQRQAEPAPPGNPLTAAEKLEQKRDRVGKLLESGRHKSALALANKLVREQPRDRECWEELAVVWAAKGNTQRSQAATEAAIACAPRDPWSYRSACMRALRLEGWAACLDFAERGKRLKIDRTVREMMMEDYGLFGARALHALWRHEEALTWLTKVAMVDAFHGSREDPLLDPRRLRKACRVALTKSL